MSGIDIISLNKGQMDVQTRMLCTKQRMMNNGIYASRKESKQTHVRYHSITDRIKKTELEKLRLNISKSTKKNTLKILEQYGLIEKGNVHSNDKQTTGMCWI